MKLKLISNYAVYSQSKPDAYQACFFAGNIPPCLKDTDKPTITGDTKLQK